jgi:hypothetical protein
VTDYDVRKKRSTVKACQGSDEREQMMQEKMKRNAHSHPPASGIDASRSSAVTLLKPYLVKVEAERS